METRGEATQAMRRWTSSEISYLHDHASDGAEEIARHLGRSVQSVQWQASQYGVSLRRSWICPRCGLKTFKALSPRTGWCSACTKGLRRMQIEEECREMREEVMRERAEDRMRGALYERKRRLRKALKENSSPR